MSQDQEPYVIDGLDTEELRHEIERLRAERDAAIASRNRWRTCAKGLAEVVRQSERGAEDGPTPD